jgi:hypothetical protein
MHALEAVRMALILTVLLVLVVFLAVKPAPMAVVVQDAQEIYSLITEAALPTALQEPTRMFQQISALHAIQVVPLALHPLQTAPLAQPPQYSSAAAAFHHAHRTISTSAESARPAPSAKPVHQ